MIELLYRPGNASLAPHILLHEIGVPFVKALADRAVQGHKRPAYLGLNPKGRIPVLRDGDRVLCESAVICRHLPDCHPAAGLAPILGMPQRARFCTWLIWMTNTFQATLMLNFHPERRVDTDHPDAAAQVRRHCRWRVGTPRR